MFKLWLLGRMCGKDGGWGEALASRPHAYNQPCLTRAHRFKDNL